MKVKIIDDEGREHLVSLNYFLDYTFTPKWDLGEREELLLLKSAFCNLAVMLVNKGVLEVEELRAIVNDDFEVIEE